MHLSEFIHYGTVALTVSLNSLSVGLGQGYTSRAALQAINRQPNARPDIMRTAILGMALIETAAIMGIFIAMLLVLGTKPKPTTFFSDVASIGIALAICTTGCVLGVVSALPAKAACLAVARQPFFGQKISGFMIMTQALIQTPIIAGLIIAVLIRNQAVVATCLSDSLRLIGSGLCIGFGSVGPAIGLAIFAQEACKGLGINRNAYKKLLSFTLISESVIETPIIFSLIIAITLLFLPPIPADDSLIHGIAYLAAGLCTALGTFGTGIASGKTAAAACKQLAHSPENYSLLSHTSLLAQGLIETCTIYAVLISLALILVQ